MWSTMVPCIPIMKFSCLTWFPGHRLRSSSLIALYLWILVTSAVSMASSVFFAALSGLVSVTASRAFCNVNHLLLSVRYQSIGLLVSHFDLHVPSGPCRGWGLPVFSFPHGRLPGFCLLSFPFNFLHRRVCVAWALSPTFPSSCPTPEFCHLCPLFSHHAVPAFEICVQPRPS